MFIVPSRFRNVLRASVALVLSGWAALPASASVIYSFTGTTDGGQSQQFSYSSSTFITSDTMVPASALTSCSAPANQCAGGVKFDPTFSQNSLVNATVFFGTNQYAYYFALGAFGATGTYGNAIPGFPQTGTLTVTGNSPAPSPLALANLSGNVYSGGSGNFGGYASFTTNCSTLPAQCSYGGFRAVAYSTADGSQIVIAFRGTDFGVDAATALKNFAADTSFTTNVPSSNLSQSVYDAAQFVQAVANANPNANITLTGHSLGGAIAQLVGKASGLTTDAFNAPGSALLYSQLANQLMPVVGLGSGGANTNYQIYGDQVSLAGQPIGSTITLPTPSGYPGYTIGNDPAANVINNFGTILADHAINTVISQLISNAPQTSSAGEPNVVAALEQMVQGNSTPTLSGNINVVELSLDILDLGGILIDPSGGTVFILNAQSGSPCFSSIDLPSLSGVASYDFRYEIGSTWSPFQTLQPGTLYSINCSASSIEFDPVDQFGNGVTVQGFLFDLGFGSTGTFSGSLSEVQSTPEPESGYLVVVGIAIMLAVSMRRKHAAGSHGIRL